MQARVVTTSFPGGVIEEEEARKREGTGKRVERSREREGRSIDQDSRGKYASLAPRWAEWRESVQIEESIGSIYTH